MFSNRELYIGQLNTRNLRMSAGQSSTKSTNPNTITATDHIQASETKINCYQDSLQNAIPISPSKSQFNALIHHLAQSTCIQNSYIMMPVTRNIHFRANIQIENDILLVKGTLVYKNGMLVNLTENYAINLLRNLYKNNLKPIVFSHLDGCLKFRVKAKLKNMRNSELDSGFFSGLIDAIQKAFIVLEEQLAIFGLNSTYFKNSLRMKQSRLKFLMQLQTILKEHQSIHSKTPTSETKEKAVTECHQIKITKQQPVQLDFQNKDIEEGKYFQFKRKFCHIQTSPQKPFENQDLMVKILKPDQSSKMFKLKRQLSIIKQLKTSDNVLKYWIYSGNQKSLFMEYIRENLTDHIYSYNNSISEIFNLSKQLASGSKILHQCGIVHRDLKLQNVLVGVNSQKKRILKIIDFGESTLISQKFADLRKEEMVGCTPPYSPPETYFFSEMGFNKKQIDYWSVGLLIYEIGFKQCPLSLNSYLYKDTLKIWLQSPNQFSILVPLMKKPGVKIIEYALNLIASQSIKIKQADRMPIDSMLKILEAGQQLLSEFLL